MIEKDIAEHKLNTAIESYKNYEVNISGGAEIAGISYREFITELSNRNISLNMDTIPIEYGVDSIKKSFKLSKKSKS